MIEMLQQVLGGNVILLVLIIFSILSVGIFFERLLVLRRSEIDTNDFILKIKEAVNNQNIIEGLRMCEQTGGAVAHIVRSGLLKHNRSREEIEGCMQTTGLCEIAKLEKNARFLSVIAHVTPLIGLLGTVLGFIQAFSEMRLSGLMDISTSKVGEAMEYALITTAAGLIVAIPTLLAYNYLAGRIQRLVLEMQTVSSEILEMLIYEI
jgi:biopolymer transport protein ExbB